MKAKDYHEAFTAAYWDAKPVVAAVIRSITRDSGVVDDLMQDTFLKGWKAFPKAWANLETTVNPNFKGWFLRIAQNVAIDYTRQRSAYYMTRPDLLAIQPDSRPDVGSHAHLSRLDSLGTITPKHLEGLTRSQLQALDLFYNRGLMSKEVAPIMGISNQAVRSLLMRARAHIKLQFLKMQYSLRTQ